MCMKFFSISHLLFSVVGTKVFDLRKWLKEVTQKSDSTNPPLVINPRGQESNNPRVIGREGKKRKTLSKILQCWLHGKKFQNNFQFILCTKPTTEFLTKMSYIVIFVVRHTTLSMTGVLCLYKLLCFYGLSSAFMAPLPLQTPLPLRTTLRLRTPLPLRTLLALRLL